jgi:hypothetical protein
MSLPAPSTISPESKATAVLIWQAVPLWVALFAFVWTRTLWPSPNLKGPKGQLKSCLNILRLTYAFAIAVAAVTHITTISISITAYLCPSIFHSSIGFSLQPLNFLVPPYLLSLEVKMGSFVEGATWFLQWDYTVTSIAYMIWAIVARYSFRSKQELSTVRSYGLLILNAIVRLMGLGPMGAALSFIWERDEIVWGLEASNRVLNGKVTNVHRAEAVCGAYLDQG